MAIAEQTLTKKKKTYSLGPLIHNRHVVRSLSDEGLKVAKRLKTLKNAYCIIPSHGMDLKAVKNRKGIRFIDTTCPFVKKAQILASQLVKKQYHLVIVGDKRHPEIKGLRDISLNRATVISDLKEAIGIRLKKNRIAVISQTTQSMSRFRAIAGILLKKGFGELRIYNTICNDAKNRQHQAEKLSSVCGLVLVIGGKNSANTKRLKEICSVSAKTYHIDDASEIKKRWLYKAKKLGIITGASTPDYLIKEVIDKIEEISGKSLNISKLT